MMYQSRCVVLLLLAACMFNPGGAEPTPALTGGYSGFNQGETSVDTLASYTGGNGGQNVDDVLSFFQQQISGGTTNPAYTTPPQSHAYPSQGTTYSQYASPSPFGGTPTYDSTYSTGATRTSFGMHSPLGLSTSPSTQSHGTGPPAPYLSGYRQPVFSQMNSNGGGDNRLPRSVIIPMTMEGGKLFAEMKVGTAKAGHPAQTLTVEFDTGSTQLWLLSADMCATGRCRANAKPFDRSMSTTYQQDGSSHMSLYGSGGVTGKFGIDTITLGEPGNQLVINNQMIGEAETTEGSVLSHSDALCGMGLVSREMWDSGDRDSFLDTMTKQYGTTLPFGFYFNRQDPQKSQMIFGEGYEQFIVEELNTHNVQLAPGKDKFDGWYVQFGGWEIEKTGYAAIPVTVDPKMLALVDTGASLIVGPEDMIGQIKQYIFSYASFHYDKSTYTFPCENAAMVFSELPNVSFYMDNIKYTIAPEDYIANLPDGCGALFHGRAGTDHIILGRPFLNKYFSRFDHSKKTVQFALGK